MFYCWAGCWWQQAPQSSHIKSLTAGDCASLASPPFPLPPPRLSRNLARHPAITHTQHYTDFPWKIFLAHRGLKDQFKTIKMMQQIIVNIFEFLLPSGQSHTHSAQLNSRQRNQQIHSETFGNMKNVSIVSLVNKGFKLFRYDIRFPPRSS